MQEVQIDAAQPNTNQQNITQPNADQRSNTDKQNTTNQIDYNSYTTTKSYGQNYLTLATITSIIELCIDVFLQPMDSFRVGLIVLCFIALGSQILLFALISVLAATQKDEIIAGRCRCGIVIMNSFITFLCSCVMVVVICINIMRGYLTIVGQPITRGQNVTV